MKGTFDAQSKPLQCAVQQQPVRSKARHLASPYRSRLPVRASAFPIIAAQEIRLQPSEGNKNPPLSFFHDSEPSKSFALPLLVLASHAFRKISHCALRPGAPFTKLSKTALNMWVLHLIQWELDNCTKIEAATC